LREVTEELNALKNERRDEDLTSVNETLLLTKDKAKLAQYNRDLERKVDVLQQRTQEYELLLNEKSINLETCQKELTIMRSEFSGVESKMLVLDE